MSAEFSIAARVQGTEGAVVFTLAGSGDAQGADRLQRAFEEHWAEGRALFLLDLAAATHLPTSMWGLLMAGLRRCKVGGGDLRLVGVSGAVKRSYESLGLPAYLRVFPDVPKALAGPPPEPVAIEAEPMTPIHVPVRLQWAGGKWSGYTDAIGAHTLRVADPPASLERAGTVAVSLDLAPDNRVEGISARPATIAGDGGAFLALDRGDTDGILLIRRFGREYLGWD